MPGNNYEFTQPIEMRFNELIAGVRSDLAVKVFGDDLDIMLRDGATASPRCLRDVPGAADVKVEQVTGLPMLTIEIDRAAIARYGLNVADVQEVVEIAIGGKPAGRCSKAIGASTSWCACPRAVRADLDAHGAAAGAPSAPVRRATLARRSRRRMRVRPSTRASCRSAPWRRSRSAEGPNQISRENGKRRVVVHGQRARPRPRLVRRRGAAADRAEVDAAARLLDRPGAASSSNLIAAAQRLAIVVPLALLLIFVLLLRDVRLRAATRCWSSPACRSR